MPDYDGRGNQDADAESWALWIPRVLLSPLYMANEYLLRRPLGALMRRAERDRWADTFAHLFGSGEGSRNLLVPTVLFDRGLLPTVGVYYSLHDVFATGNVLRLHAATWDTRSIRATVADRYALDALSSLQARFDFKRSKDNLFVGIGPDATSDTESRYGLQRLEGSLGYRRRLTNASRLDVESGLRRVSFTEGDCCDDPSLDARIAGEEVMAPPGYRETYTNAFARVELTLDSRRPRPEPGSGIYLHAQATPSVDLHDARSWLHYGGVFGGALDLTGHRRTLRAHVTLDFVDGIAGGAIPFTEYAMLGGERMPGFVSGWLMGRSTASAQLGYSWPVWLALDAQTRFTIGNAFGEHLEGLSPRKLRMSGDVGFSTNAAHNQRFEILFGLGTETFEQGGDITSVRVTLGSRRGFF